MGSNRLPLHIELWTVSRSLCIDFSSELRISLIFLSTRPCILCPPTGHVWNSTLVCLWRLDSKSIKFNLINSQPLISWLTFIDEQFYRVSNLAGELCKILKEGRRVAYLKYDTFSVFKTLN